MVVDNLGQLAHLHARDTSFALVSRAPLATPDRDFVVPYHHQLLDRTPRGRQDEFRAFRHDEYGNGAG